MQRKKEVPVWLSVILLILCVLSVIHSIYAMVQNHGSNVSFLLMCASSIVLALASAAYCLVGYKKSGAPLFKIVCLFLVVTAMTGMAEPVMEGGFIGVIIVYVLLALIGLIFLAVPNLGKTCSYVLALLNLVLTAVLMAELILTGEIIAPDGSIFAIAKMVIFGIIVYAKYVDKDSRGTT